MESLDASNNPAATNFSVQFFYDGEIPANGIDDDFDGQYEEPNGHTNYSTDSISGLQMFSANSSYSDYQYLAFYKNSDYPQLYVDNIELPTVPIPGALWLLVSGLLGLAVSRKRLQAI